MKQFNMSFDHLIRVYIFSKDLMNPHDLRHTVVLTQALAGGDLPPISMRLRVLPASGYVLRMKFCFL
jgi:integrase